jgi:hypothetical protein
LIKKRAFTTPIVMLFAFLAVNFLIGILPATLVSIENPHPLRTLGAWPFAMLATGIIVHKSIERYLWAALPATVISICFSLVFVTQYFKYYPKDSIGMFMIWTVNEAQNAKTTEDWMTFLYRNHMAMFTSRYFLMRYKGQTCQEAKDTWQNLFPIFKKIAEQQNAARP